MATRQNYSASNAGPVSNTSNVTWATLVTLSAFTPDANSNYVIFWSGALQNASSAGADAQLRVRFGASGSETTVASINMESMATSDYPQFSGMFFHSEGSSPVSIYADIAIRAETNAHTINSKNGQLVALKLGANDVIAESLSRQTSTTTTNVSAVTANFTSDGGDYVIIGYGEFDCSVTSAPVYIRLTCNGTNTAEAGIRSNDLLNFAPGMMVWRFTSVPSGSRSASFQFHAHSSTTAGITNARIVVMRASDFEAIYGSQLTSDNTGTESAYTTALTVSGSFSANPHLLLGTWFTSSSATAGTSDVKTQVTENSSQITESIRRNYHTALTRSNNNAFVSVRSSPNTWKLDRGQATSNSITINAGSSLIALDLGTSALPTITVNMTAQESGNDSLTGSGTVGINTSLTTSETGSDSLTGAITVSTNLSFSIQETESDSFNGTINVNVNLAGTIIESGNDIFSGSITNNINLSGTFIETESDSFSGSGTNEINLSGSIQETGNDNLSGNAQIEILLAVQVQETGSDIFTGSFEPEQEDNNLSLNVRENGKDNISASIYIDNNLELTIRETGSDRFRGTIKVIDVILLTMSVTEDGSDEGWHYPDKFDSESIPQLRESKSKIQRRISSSLIQKRETKSPVQPRITNSNRQLRES